MESMNERSNTPSPPRGQIPNPRDRRTSLIVKNLHFDCREDDLRGQFGEFGTIVKIYIPRRNGVSRMFGFIRYEDPEDAALAVDRMNGRILHGRKVYVEYSRYGNGRRPNYMRR